MNPIRLVSFHSEGRFSLRHDPAMRDEKAKRHPCKNSTLVRPAGRARFGCAIAEKRLDISQAGEAIFDRVFTGPEAFGGLFLHAGNMRAALTVRRTAVSHVTGKNLTSVSNQHYLE
jgi:hypothetical protein